MPISGTLTFKAHRIEATFVEGDHAEKKHALRFANVKLYINGVPADAKLTIEVL
ncbi:hypothetical protein GQ600_27943 [Phytophthora cactorum]|nr:hypothetical protein GQ600_27943 [Phytophthora cactorum]